MANPLTAADILPLIAGLSHQERVRLFRLIAGHPGTEDAALYRTTPASPDEFFGDEDSLAWDAEGWES